MSLLLRGSMIAALLLSLSACEYLKMKDDQPSAAEREFRKARGECEMEALQQPNMMTHAASVQDRVARESYLNMYSDACLKSRGF